MHIKSVIPLALACLVLAGCESEHVRITSTPPGASVSVYGTVVGKTPLTVDFFPNRPYLVRAELSGFAPAETNSVPIKMKETKVSTGKQIASGVAVVVIFAAGVAAGIPVFLPTNPTTNDYHHDPIAFVLQPLANTNHGGVNPKQ